MSNIACPMCHHRIESLSQVAHTGVCPARGEDLRLPRVHVQPPKARRPNAFDGVLLGVVVVVSIAIVALLLLPIEQPEQATTSGYQRYCRSNLKQIGLALHYYHEDYGSFPPAYIADDDGVPLLSWRVLLLPYLSEQSMYDDLRLDEPYHSDWNRELARSYVPSCFVCLEDPDSQCSYMLVTLDEGIFNAKESASLADVTDGSSNTVLVVEVHGAGINWAEPVDLGPEALDVPINFSHNGTCISSPHAGGAMALFADGRVRFLPEETSLETLRALFTKGGGEKFELP